MACRWWRVIEVTRGRGGAQNGPVDLDVEGFVRDGYVAVRGAFDAATAAACREMIWGALRGRGVREDDPATWPPFAHIDSAVHVGDGFALDGSDPSPVARAIVTGLAMAERA
jgi:hypothetical protein